MSLDDKYFAWAIFCDDIRQEVGGKFSYIGTYTSNLNSSKPFPITLPKFAIGITYYEKLDSQPEEVRVKVIAPWDKASVIETELPMAEVRSNLRSKASNFYRADLNIILAPFELKSEGILRVELTIDENNHYIGSLRIRHAPAET